MNNPATYGDKKARLTQLVNEVKSGNLDLEKQIDNLRQAKELQADLLSELEGVKVKVQGLMA